MKSLVQLLNESEASNAIVTTILNVGSESDGDDVVAYLKKACSIDAVAKGTAVEVTCPTSLVPDLNDAVKTLLERKLVVINESIEVFFSELNEAVNIADDNDHYVAIKQYMETAAKQLNFKGSFLKGYVLQVGQFAISMFIQKGVPIVEVSDDEHGFILEGGHQIIDFLKLDHLKKHIDALKNAPKDLNKFIKKLDYGVSDSW